MIQDIAPYKLKNEYCPRPCAEGDRIIIFDEEDRILVACNNEGIKYPSLSDVNNPILNISLAVSTSVFAFVKSYFSISFSIC